MNNPPIYVETSSSDGFGTLVSHGVYKTSNQLPAGSFGEFNDFERSTKALTQFGAITSECYHEFIAIHGSEMAV